MTPTEGSSEFRLECHGDFVSIEVRGYQFPDADNELDGNRLDCVIRVEIGGFLGELDTPFMTRDLAEFLGELRSVYSTLRGQARFRTIENTLSLTITMRKTGQFDLDGNLGDAENMVATLKFSAGADQTFLVQPLHDLERIVQLYPVKPFKNR